jgi:hypothetical protein
MLKARDLKATPPVAILLGAALVLAGAAAAEPVHTSSSADQVRPIGGQTATGSTKSRMHSYLSVSECKGMGGTVVPAGGCESTFTCKRADKNGVIHQSCINTADR